jgi:imidazolonepropionase-like amidohydrolase
MADSVGRIAPGMRADLVILDADPLVDVGNLQKVYRVLKDGVVYHPGQLMRE